MSLFDQDTSTRRMHNMFMDGTPNELRKPKIGLQRFFDNALSKSHGIMVGALLGVVAWAAIIVLGVAVWRSLR